jgi:integrase
MLWLAVRVKEKDRSRHTWIHQSTGQLAIFRHTQSVQNIAKRLYNDIKGRAERGEPVRDNSFGKSANGFLAWLHQQHEIGQCSQNKFTRCERLIRLHLSQDKIWKMPLRQMTQYDIDEYISRRVRKNDGRKETRISSNTIRLENSLIRGVFDYAIYRKYLATAPKVKDWIDDHNPRRSFSSDEWEQLVTFLDEWVAKAPKDHAYSRPYREIMRDYVLLLGYSGLRPNEARLLKWTHVTTDEGEPTEAYPDGEHIVHIYVDNPKHKPGFKAKRKRWATALPQAKAVIDQRRKLSEFTDPEDYVFCHPRCAVAAKPGTAIQVRDKLFAILLKDCGLRRDGETDPRTLYSLRHMFITDRLINGTDAYGLSVNVGNSVPIINEIYDKSIGPDYQEQIRVKKDKPKVSRSLARENGELRMENAALKEMNATLAQDNKYLQAQLRHLVERTHEQPKA